MKTSSLALGFLFLTLVGLSSQQVDITTDNKLLKVMIPLGITSKVLMWGKKDTMDDVKLKVELPQPEDGCEPYTNPSKDGLYGYVLQKGGRCSFGTKVHNAQAAGAIALFIQYERNDLDEIEIPDHINGKNLLLNIF